MKMVFGLEVSLIQKVIHIGLWIRIAHSLSYCSMRLNDRLRSRRIHRSGYGPCMVYVSADVYARSIQLPQYLLLAEEESQFDSIVEVIQNMH